MHKYMHAQQSVGTRGLNVGWCGPEQEYDIVMFLFSAHYRHLLSFFIKSVFGV